MDRLAVFFPQGRPRDLDPSEQSFTDLDAAYALARRTIDNRLDRAAAALAQLVEIAKGPAAAAAAADPSLPRPTTARAAAAAAAPKRFDVVGAGPRPQAFFDEPADNSNVPFVPRPWFERPGGDHPRALDLRGTPLATTSEPIGFKGYQQLPGQSYPHPYGAQLEGLAYPAHALERPERALAFRDLQTTPFAFIDSEAALEAAAERLRSEPCIAVDLEHHSFRSYQGLTCLIQISSRHEDLVIDALALRGAIPAALGPIFADPKIVKVLHGADMDVLWLQRDYGIYIVNLFDTGQAARVLEFPSFSLAYLLHHFCQIEADKSHQLSDWRARPLPEEMLHYARLDTHCLLYIYDRLRMLLHEQGEKVPPQVEVPLPEQHGAPGVTAAAPPAVLTVLERSRRVCLQLYQRELWTEQSYLDLLVQYQLTTFQKEQVAVFAALAQWRDETARRLDESLGFVMSKALLSKLAKEMPTTLKDIRMATGALSKVAKDAAAVLQRLIETAKARADAYAHVPQRLLEHKTARDAAAHQRQAGEEPGPSDPPALPPALHCAHEAPALPEITAVVADVSDPTVAHAAPISSVFDRLKARPTATATAPAASAFASVFGGARTAAAPTPAPAATATATARPGATSALAAAFAGRAAASAAAAAVDDRVLQIRASLSVQQKFAQLAAPAAPKAGRAETTDDLEMKDGEPEATPAPRADAPEEADEDEAPPGPAPVDEKAAVADARREAQEKEGMDFLPVPLSERARDEKRKGHGKGGAGAGGGAEAGSRKRKTYEDLAAEAVGLNKGEDEEDGAEREVRAFDYEQLRSDKAAAAAEAGKKKARPPPRKRQLKVYDVEEVKGGKARSKTWVKSGNRSGTFRN